MPGWEQREIYFKGAQDSFSKLIELFYILIGTQVNVHMHLLTLVKLIKYLLSVHFTVGCGFSPPSLSYLYVRMCMTLLLCYRFTAVAKHYSVCSQKIFFGGTSAFLHKMRKLHLFKLSKLQLIWKLRSFPTVNSCVDCYLYCFSSSDHLLENS